MCSQPFVILDVAYKLKSYSAKWHLNVNCTAPNRESGDGRFDLVLEPRISGLPGIIMEFKAEKDEKNLISAAKEALVQIDDKNYDTDMKDRGIKDIVKYGIAFAGKKVEIVL